MKSLITAAFGATVLAPIASKWLSQASEAVRDALRARAEVSTIMAEAYRRQR